MLDEKIEVNPYKFGMIGSTDSHTSLATAQEDNFFGKHSGVEPEPNRWKHVVIEAPNPDFTIMGWQQAAGGLAAVWARENTRAAIWDAMARKEVYATTGTRLRGSAAHKLRFPSIRQLYDVDGGNPDLEEERCWCFEVGIEQRLPCKSMLVTIIRERCTVRAGGQRHAVFGPTSRQQHLARFQARQLLDNAQRRVVARGPVCRLP